MYDLATVALASLAIYAFYVFLKFRFVTPNLPPSPKPHHFLGHLLSFPSVNQHIAYRDISKQLNSDIISFNVLGQIIVVLNSVEATTDLLVKRSAIYSDRAELPMLNDDRLVAWGKVTSFMRYGERWKLQRKLTQFALQSPGSEELMATPMRQTRITMRRLLERPDSILSELRWLTGANILNFVYGYQPSYPSDHIIDVIDAAMVGLGMAAVAGNFYVNTIPWLKYVPAWLPGAGWKRQANRWREDRENMVNEPYEWTLSQMAQGNKTPSVLKTLLDKIEKGKIHDQSNEERQDVARWVVGTLYAAGADTIIASMSSFVLAMVLHPAVQEKVQKELDAVLGGDRLPDLSDRSDLPYLDCVIKEVLRWNPVAPLAVPHACMQDDVYRGYMIPKKAMVIGNIWAISHNPSVYPEPSTFNPDRFLDRSLPEPPVFGFGRRVCPGSRFAHDSLFLLASNLLAIYNITPTPGRPAPKANFGVDMLVSHPHSFSCTLAPRSEQHRLLIETWIDC